MKQKVLWFRAKKYGWGWYPITWQGWAVTIGYVLYEFALTAFLGDSLKGRAGLTSLLFFTLLGIIVLLAICYKFGEEPRWRWGKD